MSIPPRSIPDNLKNAFTLNGQIPIYDWYINDSVPDNSVIWSNKFVQSFINRFTIDNIKNNRQGAEQYNEGAYLHMKAFEKYKDHIINKKVAVIGSHNPWVEAILVNFGAKEVITVEYNVPICDHDKIRTTSYAEFCTSSEKYDSVVSYSSIEHSGLGRYGDPLNPNGDIETMEQIYKSLNKDGLCFLGIPVGRDHLVWNAHRIYGEKRLKIMYLDKFKELDWIGCDKNYIYTCAEQNGNPKCNLQPIIILQK